MFEVRVYDGAVRYVVLNDPELPELDSDPPDSTLIDPAGTRKDFLAEYFDKYRGAIVRKIEEGGGKAAINKLGEHLKTQPEFDERVYNAALGKTKDWNRLFWPWALCWTGRMCVESGNHLALPLHRLVRSRTKAMDK